MKYNPNFFHLIGYLTLKRPCLKVTSAMDPNPSNVLKALRRGTASDPVGMARRRLGGRLGEQGDAL